MTAEPTAQASGLVAAIRAGTPLMAMLGGPEQGAALEAGIAGLAAEPIGFVRIGNPLVSPLSVERLVLQITRDAIEEERLEDAERVLRALITRSEARRLVVVVEQAETLTAGAYTFLRGLTTLSHPGLARVQVVLAGTPALATRIAGGGTHVVGVDSLAAPAGPAQTSPAPVSADASPAEAPGGRRNRSLVLVLAGVGVCGVAALLLATPKTSQPDATPAAPPPALQAPSPSVAAPVPREAERSLPPVEAALPTDAAAPSAPIIAPAAAEAAPVPPQVEASIARPPGAAPPPDQETAAAERDRLYREFNAFLSRRSLGRQLSQAERETLFQEYLSRRQTAPSRLAAPASAESSRIPGEPRVVLFFAAASEPDLVAAQGQAEFLRDRVASLELQPASEVPVVPTIRYEFPADRPAALALAQTIRTKGGTWQVEDMEAIRKRPEPGTIEVWLPRE